MTSLAPTLTSRLSSRAIGVALAFADRVVSGVAVYVNAQGVAHFDDATVYTTAKNAVAGALLLALALPAARRRASQARSRAAPSRGAAGSASSRSRASAAASRSSSSSRASRARPRRRRRSSRRRSSIWVALLAVPLLRERLGPAHVAAIALVVAGQAWLAGDAGTVALRQRRGDDPRGDAALGGRGDPRQAPGGRARARGSLAAAGWRSASLILSPGSSCPGARRRLARPRARRSGSGRSLTGLLLTGVRRHLVRRARPCAQADRRHRGARLRRGRHRAARRRVADGAAVDVGGHRARHGRRRARRGRAR